MQNMQKKCKICHIKKHFKFIPKYAKYANKYAKYVSQNLTCRICTPHFADAAVSWQLTAGR
jgi:hypothetical protein